MFTQPPYALIFLKFAAGILIFTGMAGYDVCEARPILTAWFQRVRENLQPHYDDGHRIVNKILTKQGMKSPGAKL